MQEMYKQGNSTEGKEPMAAMNLEGQGREQIVNMAEGVQRSDDRLELAQVWKVCVGSDGI